MLDKLIIFHDNEIIFGVFKDRYMLTGCIFRPQKIGRPLNEANCVKISSFWENINHDQTTFLLAESLFLLFYPNDVKWRSGFNWYHFQCALGSIRSLCKPKTDTKVWFSEHICTKILIELFSWNCNIWKHQDQICKCWK